jgi:iron complex transport system ATP-binding protein
VLPQESALTFPFTVQEVVLMGRTPHERTAGRAEDDAIVCAALEAVECQMLTDRIYTTLSGGERQRVQLARVLAQIWDARSTSQPPGARYLLLDEPTASLDLAYQHGTLDIARRFARAGVGVLAILHDLNLAAQYADRLAVLQAGRMVALGTPAQVLQPSLIERVFAIPALVMPHPCLECMHVVPVPRAL